LAIVNGLRIEGCQHEGQCDNGEKQWASKFHTSLFNQVVVDIVALFKMNVLYLKNKDRFLKVLNSGEIVSSQTSETECLTQC
jgi:hypothetical protein